MGAILLDDLLHLEDSQRIKIKFNKSTSYSDPLELYQKNPEIINSEWLFWRTNKRYFYEGDIAICFVKLSWNMWLLTTIKRITKDLDVKNGINYEGEELEEYNCFYGRVIVEFHKTFASQGAFYSSIKNELIVNQILPSTFDGNDFPGYDNVRLSYSQLEIIVKNNKKDWKAALENQKAVYLITDTNTGKLYVGSATGDKGMLLQRWSNYVYSYHGGNVELKELVSKEGEEYVKKYFQYSILENFNAKVDDNYILRRETWWKETLNSKKNGYNGN